MELLVHWSHPATVSRASKMQPITLRESSLHPRIASSMYSLRCTRKMYGIPLFTHLHVYLQFPAVQVDK